MGWPTMLPAEQRPEVAKTTIQRYLDGETIQDIAAEYGVTRHRLYQVLSEEAEEAWKSAQVAYAINNLEECEAELKAAPDMLTIARAREAARIAQWKLERLCRRIYGTDAPPTNGQGTIAIQINFGQPQDIPSAQVVDRQG